MPFALLASRAGEPGADVAAALADSTAVEVSAGRGARPAPLAAQAVAALERLLTSPSLATRQELEETADDDGWVVLEVLLRTRELRAVLGDPSRPCGSRQPAALAAAVQRRPGAVLELSPDGVAVRLRHRARPGGGGGGGGWAVGHVRGKPASGGGGLDPFIEAQLKSLREQQADGLLSAHDYAAMVAAISGPAALQEGGGGGGGSGGPAASPELFLPGPIRQPPALPGHQPEPAGLFTAMSFNVLADFLAKPAWFPRVDPAVLAWDGRRERLVQGVSCHGLQLQSPWIIPIAAVS